MTTISPALPYALFDREVSHITETEKYNGEVVFNGMIDCARACLAAGITVGLGTDTGCPYITHYDMWRELNYFHKYCGVSNAFALHTATMINAEIAGLSDVTGSIAAASAPTLSSRSRTRSTALRLCALPRWSLPAAKCSTRPR